MLPLQLFAQSIMVFNNSLFVDDTQYVIADGIKVGDDYVMIGSVTVLLSNLDAGKFYIENGRTLVFGNSKYKLSDEDQIIVKKQACPKTSNDEISESLDEILVLSSDISINKTQCTIIKRGKKYPLHGKVKIVDNNEDFKIRVVDNWEDIRIRLDDNGSDCCCFKLYEDLFEDIKVKIVDTDEDVKIKLVDVFESVSF